MHCDVAVGDCRAVLCRSGHAVALSEDQTANVVSERERVQAAGAKVQWLVDSWRVGDAGIQVSRYHIQSEAMHQNMATLLGCM